jgi:uncharacterized membrane protein YedE/YeeE
MWPDLFPQGIIHYLVGGVMIGSAVALLFLLTGLVGGMSTVFSSSWSWLSREEGFRTPALLKSRLWRLVYAAGLILGGGLSLLLGGETFITAVSPPKLLLGGILIGFGARLSQGCTAGHGICGLASLRGPSLVAVITFLATAIGTANLINWLGMNG